jgi:hypothetical protein
MLMSVLDGLCENKTSVEVLSDVSYYSGYFPSEQDTRGYDHTFPGRIGSPTNPWSYLSRKGLCALMSHEPTTSPHSLETTSASQESDIVFTPAHGADTGCKGRLYHPRRNPNVSARYPVEFIPATSSSSNTGDPNRVYPYTKRDKYCNDTWLWKRHEASVHGKCDLTRREWASMPNETFMLSITCVFCSEVVESLDHYDKHDVQPCLNKCTTKHTSALEDLHKQHVKGSHLKTGKD